MSIVRSDFEVADLDGFTELCVESLDEAYEGYRDDDRRDAWEGDDDWAEVFASDDDTDWEEFSDWCDEAESSDCDDPTIY